MNLQNELLGRKREMLKELEKKRSSNEIFWNEFYEMIRAKFREEFQKYPFGESIEIILEQYSKDKDYVYQDLIQSLIYGKDPEFLQSFLKFTSQEGIVVGIDRSSGFSKIKCKMLMDPKEIEQRQTNTVLFFGHIKNEFSINYYVQMGKETTKDGYYAKIIDFDENLDISYFFDLCKAYLIEVSIKSNSNALSNVKDKDYADYKMILKVCKKDVAQWSKLRDVLEVIVKQTENYAQDFLDPYHYKSRRPEITYLGGISDKLFLQVDEDCVGDYKNLVAIENQIIDMDYYKELLEKGGYSLTINSTKNGLSISRKKNA